MGTLSKKELKAFALYLASPYFNLHTEPKLLFKHLSNHHPDFTHQHIERGKVFEQIFGKVPFNERQLNYMMSELCRLLEDFLLLEELQQQPQRRQMLLLDMLNHRRLDKFFKQETKAVQADLEGGVIGIDIEHYRYLYLLHEQIALFETQRDNRFDFAYLSQMLDYLDVFYIANKLKYACEILNYQNVLRIAYQPALLPEVMTHIQEKELHHLPIIQAYYLVYLTLKEPEQETHFENLIQKLDEFVQVFKADLLRELHIYARNYCIKKLNSGNISYLNRLFELYQKALEQGLLFTENVMSEWDYKNITSIALRLNEIKWVEQFIHRYRNYLNETVRQNAYNFNLASVYFHQKEYSNTIATLRDVNIADTYYFMETKSLLLKTYFELDETLVLISLTDSLKKYLHLNKKIAAFQKEIRLKFITFLKRLLKIKLMRTNKISQREKLQDLRTKIAAAQVADKTWLLQKTDSMMGALL